jgi:hypothetical protein
MKDYDGSPALRALSDPTTTSRGLQNVKGSSVIRTEKGSDLSELPEFFETQESEVQVINITIARRNIVFNVILFMNAYLH